MTSSYWLAEEPPRLDVPRLDGSLDVAVVGGGVTGCACARVLAEAGLRVRLHEAREIASGASGRNGGFAVRGGAPWYAATRAQLGREQARALWKLTERYLDRLAELAGDAFRRTGSLRLAADAGERAELEGEYEALREDGFAAEWRDEVPEPLAGRYQGAILHPPDGSLQPARWVRRLAGLAAAAGAELREGERVESLEELEADHVVIATDGYTQGLVPELDAAVLPTRGQVVVTEPLDDPRPFIPGEHFVAAPADRLAKEALAVVADDERRRRIVETGQRFLRERLSMAASLAEVLAP